MEREYVFVYGTLMRGHGNNVLLRKERASFFDEGVVRGFGLYQVSRSFPGVVREESSLVLGEVFRIHLSTLEVLDRLEGRGIVYDREKVPVTVQSTGRKVDAWIYLWLGSVDSFKRIPLSEQPWGRVR